MYVLRVTGTYSSRILSSVMEQFPQGDTLGVVFSFLSARELLRGQIFHVSKEWRRALRELSHAWGNSLDLRWAARLPALPSIFAWHRISVRQA